MNHQIKLEDFEYYDVDTLLASSSEDHKRLFLSVNPILNTVVYRLEYTNMDGFNVYQTLERAIKAYNEA